MKEYKVWIAIEEIDEDHGVYQDVDEPMSLATFSTLEKADKFRNGVYDRESLGTYEAERRERGVRR